MSTENFEGRVSSGGGRCREQMHGLFQALVVLAWIASISLSCQHSASSGLPQCNLFFQEDLPSPPSQPGSLLAVSDQSSPSDFPPAFITVHLPGRDCNLLFPNPICVICLVNNFKLNRDLSSTLPETPEDKTDMLLEL